MTAGFQRAIERHDLIDVPVRGVTTDSGHDAIRAEIGRLMAARRRPDGFVCGSAAAAIAAIAAAEGLRAARSAATSTWRSRSRST